jgi:hypothetical protein
MPESSMPESQDVSQRQAVIKWTAVGIVVSTVGTLLFVATQSDWRLGIMSIGLSIVLWLIALLTTPYIRRAYALLLFRVAMVAIASLPFWGLGISFSNEALEKNSWIMIGAALLSSTLGSLFYYQDILRKLQQARRYNEASGYLDKKRGLVNLRVNPRIEIPQVERGKTQWTTIGRWGIALAPAIGQFIARAGNEGQVFMALIAFILAYSLMTIGVARSLAMITDIRSLENELGKKFLVPAE